MSALLEVRGLSKHFGDTVAVSEASFDVGHAESVGLVGGSGSGKTTLARTVLMLERPDAGRVTFDGKDLSGLRRRPLRAARAGMQCVFQSPLGSLDPRWTAFRSVEEPLLNKIKDRDARTARVEECFTLVGLKGLSQRRPSELSGGQAQRVAIARAISTGPKLIVCDEITSGLDVSVQAQILNLMKDLQERLSIAFLLISHDLAVIAYACNRVIVMRRGMIVETAPTADILRDPEHGYTRQLLSAAQAIHEGGAPNMEPA